jgi:hypothetical protein
MTIALRAALAALLVSGALLLLLGLLFWSGTGLQLVGLHVALGLVLVGSLWVIAWIAARVGVPMSTVAPATGWGVVVLALGLAQRELMPGSWHWTVQLLHLVVSMAAMWWGRRLVAEIRRVSLARAGARPGAPVPSSAAR